MKGLKFLWILGVVAITACSTTQNATQSTVNGDDLMNSGQYASALSFYENNIAAIKEKGKDVSPELIKKTAKAAYKAQQIEKAIAYFEQITFKNVDDEEMLVMLADCYKHINNLSKEITVLEKYQNKFSNGAEINKVKTRLFETTLESEDWELTEKIWKGFGESAKTDAVLLDIYLKAIIAQKQNEKAEALAKDLLKIDADNIAALEIMAIKYFWKAENRYQAETEAYNKKRTRKQYAKLLKALDIVTVDFKRSLNYFKKLYAMNPTKEYARYLGNIYARLDDKEKSTYYKNRAR